MSSSTSFIYAEGTAPSNSGLDAAATPWHRCKDETGTFSPVFTRACDWRGLGDLAGLVLVDAAEVVEHAQADVDRVAAVVTLGAVTEHDVPADVGGWRVSRRTLATTSTPGTFFCFGFNALRASRRDCGLPLQVAAPHCHQNLQDMMCTWAVPRQPLSEGFGVLTASSSRLALVLPDCDCMRSQLQLHSLARLHM